MRAPCVRCGHLLLTDEDMRVTVTFNADELVTLSDLTFAARNDNLRNRLLCALGLIDPAREKLEREA